MIYHNCTRTHFTMFEVLNLTQQPMLFAEVNLTYSAETWTPHTDAAQTDRHEPSYAQYQTIRSRE